jgi:acyl-CoA synthetase (AMP-forming)/AMP-acid ligase II
MVAVHLPMPFPEFEPTVPTLLRMVAQRFAARQLIVHGGRRLTYAEVEQRSALLARGLLTRGVGKGTRVGLLLPNGPDWIIAFLAATRIGAIAVPINTFFKPRELGWVLRHADVHLLLAIDRFLKQDFVARIEAAVPDLDRERGERLFLESHPYLREIRVLGAADRPWAGEAARLFAEAPETPSPALLRAVESEVTPADAAVVIYTSGSTAEPRGAIHTQGTLVRHAFNVNSVREIRTDDRLWSPMPFFWVGGLVVSLLGVMHVGACLLSEDAFDAEKTLDLLESERATLAGGWPHFGKAMADHPSFARRDLTALRSGNLELLSPDKRPADPTLRPNSLGMTETCGPHSWSRPGDPPEKLRGSFGPPLDGVEHKIVDPASGRELPAGEAGELWVRGYNLMQGLYKVEREQAFARDGFFRTGDGGHIDADGYLTFTGRLGEMIKTGGANVAPSEVERVLMGFAEIQSAFVVGLPDEARGEIVAAAIVLHPGHALGADEVRARLRDELAAYKLPRQVLFATAEELPFTDSGKIDKRRLRELLVARFAAAPHGAGAG